MDITSTAFTTGLQSNLEKSKLDKVQADIETLRAQAATKGATTDPSQKSPSRAAAEQFESAFLEQMLNYMWQDVPTDGLFGGGHGEETFRSMLVNEYAKEMTRAGGIGIADQVEQELLKLQETAK